LREPAINVPYRFIVTAVLLELTGTAMSCPPLESCVTQLHSTTRPQRALAHTPAVAVAPDFSRLTRSLLDTTRPRRAPGEIEMPWIWQALSTQVYSRMPTYEQSHSFKIMLAPVIVTSPSDTVPGVGIAGDF
jgi:hypothetical protein